MIVVMIDVEIIAALMGAFHLFGAHTLVGKERCVCMCLKRAASRLHPATDCEADQARLWERLTLLGCGGL